MVFTLGLRHTFACLATVLALVQFLAIQTPPLRLGRCRKNLPLCAPSRMVPRQYQYVGPTDIRDTALASSPAGTPIRCVDDLLAWLASRSSDAEPDDSLIATFTIDVDNTLLLAPRRWSTSRALVAAQFYPLAKSRFSLMETFPKSPTNPLASVLNLNRGRLSPPHWTQFQLGDPMISQRASCVSPLSGL